MNEITRQARESEYYAEKEREREIRAQQEQIAAAERREYERRVTSGMEKLAKHLFLDLAPEVAVRIFEELCQGRYIPAIKAARDAAEDTGFFPGLLMARMIVNALRDGHYVIIRYDYITCQPLAEYRVYYGRALLDHAFNSGASTARDYTDLDYTARALISGASR